MSPFAAPIAVLSVSGAEPGAVVAADVVEELRDDAIATRRLYADGSADERRCLRPYVEGLDRLVDAAVVARERLLVLPAGSRAGSELRVVGVAVQSGRTLVAEAGRCVVMGDGELGFVSVEVTGDERWDVREIVPSDPPDFGFVPPARGLVTWWWD